MVSKARRAIFAFLGFAALAILVPATTQAVQLVDVTFTVPVQIQNIHSGWSKVGVFCAGYQQGFSIKPSDYLQVGVIDVSNKAGGSINQTVTGAIKLRDVDNAWACELKIQYQGENDFPSNDTRIMTEVKNTSDRYREGQF